jgi:hypothetical protein
MNDRTGPKISARYFALRPKSKRVGVYLDCPSFNASVAVPSVCTLPQNVECVEKLVAAQTDSRFREMLKVLPLLTVKLLVKSYGVAD